MKKFALHGLIACLASLPAFANCTEPPAPARMPDGATASREDMLSAMKAVQIYDAAVKEFTDCARQHGSAQLAQANDAMNKLTAIADRFNSELLAFKKKNGS